MMVMLYQGDEQKALEQLKRMWNIYVYHMIHALTQDSSETKSVYVCVCAFTSFACAIACEQFSFGFILRACVPL